MAIIGETELKEQIKTNDFSNVYLIYGEENYLKEFYVNKLKSKLVDAAFADFNYHTYEGKNTPLGEILQDAELLPMMSKRSFLLVHDYPLDKSAADVKELEAFFEDVPDTCTLVFWCDTLEVDLKKSSKWKSIVRLFSKVGSAVQLDRRTEGELVKLIVSSAKKRSCTISPDRARYLISVVGADIQTIFNELEKLCAFRQTGEITGEDIDSLAVKSLQARVYDLSKYILKGDGDGAYTVLKTLFEQKEEPVAILAVISSCYVDMYRVKCAKAANVNENELSNYFSYKGREFLIRNAARDCRNISFEGLRAALDVLGDTDEAMKSTAVDKNILLEEAVAKLLRGAR